MVKMARRLSVVFQADQVPEEDVGEFANALASHVLGARPTVGEHLQLPGWPAGLVDEVEPQGAQVGPGTELDIHVAPPSIHGALHLAFVVDASLTMGRGGGDSPFQRAARTVDALLLNARAFIAEVGVVVQGGTTRQVDPLAEPEGVSGATILKVTPQGMCDLAQGITRAVELLDDAGPGPRVIVVVTDGTDLPKEGLPVVRAAVRDGVRVVGLTSEPSARLDELCRLTGGSSHGTPEELFTVLAELAGTTATWSAPPEAHSVNGSDEAEFEVVIEAMED